MNTIGSIWSGLIYTIMKGIEDEFGLSVWSLLWLLLGGFGLLWLVAWCWEALRKKEDAPSQASEATNTFRSASKEAPKAFDEARRKAADFAREQIPQQSELVKESFMLFCQRCSATRALKSPPTEEEGLLLNAANPLFPALRSSPTAFSGASRKKQIPSSEMSLSPFSMAITAIRWERLPWVGSKLFSQGFEIWD